MKRATAFAGVRYGAPVRNPGAHGSRAPNRIIPFHALPTFRPAPANAFSVWQQMSAGEATDRILAGLVFSFTPTAAGTLGIQIGTGAAGAEVPIFEFDIDNNISGAGSTPFTTEYAHIPFIKVAAGTRIAMRTYSQTAAGAGPNVGAYIDTLDATQAAQDWQAWFDSYLTGGKVSQLVTTPAIGAPITIAGGAGVYTQIIAAAATSLLVLGVCHSQVSDGISSHGQLAIATGAAGAEVDHAYIPMPGSTSTFRFFGSSYLARPVLVNAGERLSASYDYSNNANNCALYFWIATVT